MDRRVGIPSVKIVWRLQAIADRNSETQISKRIAPFVSNTFWCLCLFSYDFFKIRNKSLNNRLYFPGLTYTILGSLSSDSPLFKLDNVFYLWNIYVLAVGNKIKFNVSCTFCFFLFSIFQFHFGNRFLEFILKEIDWMGSKKPESSNKLFHDLKSLMTRLVSNHQNIGDFSIQFPSNWSRVDFKYPKVFQIDENSLVRGERIHWT